MRQKRAKSYRKLMQLYSMSFGFRQPYQVLGTLTAALLAFLKDSFLVDSELCKEAVAHKIELVKQIYTVLQGEVKPMITQCCIHELYLQGKSQQPAVDIAKTFERRKCNHREPIPGDECLESVIGESNRHRYIVASQFQPLRAKLRTVPATPLIHLTRSVMVLEPPSDVTLAAKEKIEEGRLHATGSDLHLVGSSLTSDPPKKKRKGPKGPNPLSVKQKKAVPVDSPASNRETPTLAIPKVGDKRRAEDDEDNLEKVQPSKRKRKRRKTVSTLTNKELATTSHT
ncbi:Fcf1-domain-containing protein [Crepidotus variabilis]|uniref:U three protein 23 n=1 Tax=Crepidotus variabilis TaxID=179855 RepID=A0A9P6JX91_9AGAR|nr:Fcf1-domain-containing protein [Crepidotus variabilis]